MMDRGCSILGNVHAFETSNYPFKIFNSANGLCSKLRTIMITFLIFPFKKAFIPSFWLTTTPGSICKKINRIVLGCTEYSEVTSIDFKKYTTAPFENVLMTFSLKIVSV